MILCKLQIKRNVFKGINYKGLFIILIYGCGSQPRIMDHAKPGSPSSRQELDYIFKLYFAGINNPKTETLPLSLLVKNKILDNKLEVVPYQAHSVSLFNYRRKIEVLGNFRNYRFYRIFFTLMFVELKILIHKLGTCKASLSLVIDKN